MHDLLTSEREDLASKQELDEEIAWSADEKEGVDAVQQAAVAGKERPRVLRADNTRQRPEKETREKGGGIHWR